MLKHIKEQFLICGRGHLDASASDLTFTFPQKIIGKNLVIEKIVAEFYIPDASMTYWNPLQRAFSEYDENSTFVLLLSINDSMVDFLNIMPLFTPLTDLDLFVENFQNISCRGDFNSSNGYGKMRIFIYGYTVQDSFNKTKSKMVYDN